MLFDRPDAPATLGIRQVVPTVGKVVGSFPTDRLRVPSLHRRSRLRMAGGTMDDLSCDGGRSSSSGPRLGMLMKPHGAHAGESHGDSVPYRRGAEGFAVLRLRFGVRFIAILRVIQ